MYYNTIERSAEIEFILSSYSDALPRNGLRQLRPFPTWQPWSMVPTRIWRKTTADNGDLISCICDMASNFELGYWITAFQHDSERY